MRGERESTQGLRGAVVGQVLLWWDTASHPWAPGPRSAQASTASTFRRPGCPTLGLGQGGPIVRETFTQHPETLIPGPTQWPAPGVSQVALGGACPGDCWQLIPSRLESTQKAQRKPRTPVSTCLPGLKDKFSILFLGSLLKKLSLCKRRGYWF